MNVLLVSAFQPSYYKDKDHYELECEGETEFRLVIPCVKIDYTGSYTVLAKNSSGSVKAIVSLQVGASKGFYTL
jgi:hypothetical protein